MFLLYDLPFVVDGLRLLLGGGFEERIFYYRPDRHGAFSECCEVCCCSRSSWCCTAMLSLWRFNRPCVVHIVVSHYIPVAAHEGFRSVVAVPVA